MIKISGLRCLPCLILSLMMSTGLSAWAGEMLADDKNRLQDVLRQTLPIAEEQFARLDSDVVLVYHQRVFEAETKYYTETENLVWWVRRGEAEDLTNWVRDLAPGVKVEKVKAFVIRGGEVSTAAALAAKPDPLDKSRIKIQEGDKESRYTNIVLAFDTARPGDLIGISIQKKVPHGLNWVDWLLADDYPVARCELQVKNDFQLAFAVFGNRFRKGAMKQEVLQEENGHVRNIRIWTDNLNPVFREPYSAPRILQSPSFSLVWRAERIPWGSGGYIWYEYRDWNMIASKMAATEREYGKKKKQTEKLAKSLAEGLEGDELLNRFYTYVRDDLQLVASNYYVGGDDETTVDDVLKARAGAVYEKCYLLLFMLRSQDIEAQVIWAHDSNSGGFFPRYPNWGQMDTPFVKATVNGRDVWFDLGCTACGLGRLRERFAGAYALTYDREADELDQELWGKAVEYAGGRHTNPVVRYLDIVERVNWNEIIFIKAGATEGEGVVAEKMVLSRGEKGKHTGELQLISSGLTVPRSRAAKKRDVEAVVRDWAEDRFPDANVGSTVSASGAEADTLDVVFEVDLDPVPKPMGDTWILPPDLVYGEPSVREWPEPRYSAFHVDHDNESRWEFQIPLPEGWTAANVPGDHTYGVNCFLYHVTYSIENGSFVVRRSLKVLGGTINAVESLVLLGRQSTSIRELELTPVVLTREQ